MEIAPEEFSECGLIAARRALAPELPDLLDLGAIEPHILIRGEREDPAQGPVQSPDGEIFHLAPFARRGVFDHRRQ